MPKLIGGTGTGVPALQGQLVLARNAPHPKPGPPPPPSGPISSAGVFDSNGNLVRTIWSAQVNDPRVSNPVAAWDGTLDDMSVAPTGQYTVKLLTHNIQYTWEGVVGNSSPDHTNNVSLGRQAANGQFVLNYYHAYESQLADMCINAAGEMYFVTQYDERLRTDHVALESNPQYPSSLLAIGFRFGAVGQSACCTDGINTYIAWNGIQTNGSAVWAATCGSTHIPTVFTADFTNPNPGPESQFFIANYVSSGDSTEFIDDIAVQVSGNILFITRPLLNTIFTLNKTTGAALQTFTSFINPDAIECNPVTGDLWVSRRVDSAVTNSTFDPLYTTSQWTLSGGNLTATITAASGSANVAYSSGSTASKFYYEMLINSNGGVSFGIPVGIASKLGTHNFGIGFDAFTAGYYGDGTFNVNSVHTGGYATFGNGDNVSIACDPVNSLIWFRVNGGNWNNSPSANPATGSGGISISGIGSTFYAAIAFVAGGQNGGATAKFASGSWTYAAPSGFSQLPGVNHIPTVSKCTVDGSGNITAAGIDIGGFQLPQALNLAISPDGSTLLVADGGTVQQIKAFNTSDGSVKTAWGNSGTLGDLGGYVTNGPAVSNTRFMFTGFAGGSGGGGAWIAYSSNGSFWMSDPGNMRYLHFSSGNSPAYIEQICHIPGGSAWLCGNDDTRVFCFYLEYKIDYSKPLQPGNGSWTLVNNWSGGGTVPQFPDQYGADRYTITGTNGRTYRPKPTGGAACTWYEMTSTGLRNTGVVANFNYIDENFNLWLVPNINPFFGPGSVSYYFNPFTGFDASNNPTWADNPTVAPSRPFLTTTTLPVDFPEITDPVDANNPSNAVQRLQNGNIVVFAPESGFGSHIAGLNPTTGAIAFKTHNQVGGGSAQAVNFGKEQTVFPPIPYFVNATHPGGFECHKTGATDFFTEFRGEEWGNNQTNVWSHWDQSGLLVDRWGVAAPYFGVFQTTTENPNILRASNLPFLNTLHDGLSSVPQRAAGVYSFMGEPGMAGNAAWGGVAFQNGNYYLYHSDEFYHGGVHRWMVSNLTTKQIRSFPVSWNSANYAAPTPNAYNFLAGLSYSVNNLPNNNGGWVRNPTADSGTRGTAPWINVYTNALVCDPHLPPDLAFDAALGGSGSATLSYSWTRIGIGNWSLSGQMFPNGYGTRAGGVDQDAVYIDILDNAGKILVRLQNIFIFEGNQDGFMVNGAFITGPFTSQNVWGSWVNQIQPFSIVANVGAGTMTVSYAGFTMTGVTVHDVGADINHPAQFMITHFKDPGNGDPLGIVFTQLQFADIS